MGGAGRSLGALHGWPMSDGGLVIKGIDTFLRSHQSNGASEKYTDSILQADPALGCSIFVGQGRRLVQIACRWDPEYTIDTAVEGMLATDVAMRLPNMIEECVKKHLYEKAAALSVFHGDLKRATHVLQQGSAAMASDYRGRDIGMQLVAMAIAGYCRIPGNNSSSLDSYALWLQAA